MVVVLKHYTNDYFKLITWGQMYLDTTFDQKKMIAYSLIKRIDVFRDYKLKIDFNFNLNQFVNGLDSAG